MLKNIFYFLSFFIIFSCSEKQQIIGHWHEYIGNNKDFRECIIINNSTFSIDKNTIGGEFDYYEDFNFILQYVYYDSLIFQNYKIKKEFISINDSIKWIKQEEDTQTFINDFSAGLKINIEPFTFKYNPKDSIKNFDKKSNKIVFIGKPKEFVNKKFNKNNYFYQLNENLNSDHNILFRYFNCHHCKSFNDYNYIVISDKNIPKDFLNQFKQILNEINVKNENVFFMYSDTSLNKIGYKNLNEINDLLK